MKDKIIEKNDENLKRYYSFHSAIYDKTRWAFLFGRSQLISEAAKFAKPQRILEVGCGTGANMVRLHKFFPEAYHCGVDLSSHMLEICERKMKRAGAKFKLYEQSYQKALSGDFDLIIFSYCLSMINPGWEDAIFAAKKDLKDGGVIAVVDFEGTPSAAFKKWMAVNHVKMEYHLAGFLHKEFQTLKMNSIKAYGGLWTYFIFIGRK